MASNLLDVTPQESKPIDKESSDLFVLNAIFGITLECLKKNLIVCPTAIR